MAKSPHLSRQEFVTIMVGALGTIMGAIVGLPAIGYIVSPALKKTQTESWVKVGPVDDYPVGEPTLFTFTRSKVNGWEKTTESIGVYIVRETEDSVIVLSNVCTHLGCRVTWKDDIDEYVCPCHDGHFDLDGDVTHGPPPRPLDQYETKIEDGVISIRLMEG